MKRIFAFIFIVLALGLFQATWLDFFRVFGIKPDLLLASVFAASLFFEFRWAFLFSILAGITKDAFGSTPFGLNTLLFSLWSYLISKLSRKVSIEDDIAAASLFFIVALLHNILTGISIIYSGSFIPFGIFLRIIFFAALYAALTLPLISKIVRIRI